MISISKISSISTMPKTKNLSKVVLPSTSSLGILAGSSLGEGFPPSNIEHIPGTSAEDSIIDQFEHTGDMIMDLGSEIGESVVNGASHVVDKFLDLASDVLDALS